MRYWLRTLGILLTVMAASTLLLRVSTAAISRGYTTKDSGLQTGMVAALSIDESSDSNVERATQDNSNRVVGVVVRPEDSLLSISSGTAEVLVESEGQVNAYASDLNGAIHQGDSLVLSPLRGVLMKLGNEPAYVIGVAAENPEAPETYTYDDNGQSKETKVAKVKINLNQRGSGLSGSLPSDSTLANLGRSLAGREIAEIRVLVALILFVIVLIAEGSIIYGAISSAITALGRNPYAHRIIAIELLKVTIMAGAVLLLGLGAVYAVLRA